MKDLLFTISALAVGASIVALVMFSLRTPPREIYPTTCRLLNTDPDFYRDLHVKIPTEGMQTTENPRELVYRTNAEKAPVVILYFSGPIPDPLPKFVTGTCRGRLGAVVIIADCR